MTTLDIALKVVATHSYTDLHELPSCLPPTYWEVLPGSHFWKWNLLKHQQSKSEQTKRCRYLPSQVKFVFWFTFPRWRKMKVSRSRCQVHLELEWNMDLLTIPQADSDIPYLLKSIHSIVINVNENKEHIVGVWLRESPRVSEDGELIKGFPV